MKASILLVLFGVLNAICYSQPNKTSILDKHNVYDKKGDYFFEKKAYKKAIVYYNMAYEKDTDNYYSVLKKGEAFTAMDLYDQAIECYRHIFKSNLQIPNEYLLQYAMLLLKNKNITGFDKWMSKYNEIVHSEIYDFRTSVGIRAKMYKDTTIVIVENESVLNTPESEIAPVIHNGKLIFASTRKDLSGGEGNDYYNLFSASYLNSGHLGRLNVFNTSLNSTQSESAAAFSPKTNQLYFTRSSSDHANLKTYVSDIPVNNSQTLQAKEFTIAGFGNIGQICFNSNGTKMYFASDAPGGSGGLDLYSSELTAGRWSKPKNMGSAINTNKDDMYPFVLHDTMLYFSSAGHNSLGGLDLFVVNLKHENSTPKNLGDKINSAYDDYALTFSPQGLTGYFCSNRPGGFGKEDIYQLHILNIKKKLAAYQFKKRYFMQDDKINLYLSNGTEYNIASDGNSGFIFSFRPGEAYKMIVRHENPIASNIIYNDKLTEDQKEKEFLDPAPFQKTTIKLQAGMRYQFTDGMSPVSNDYKNSLSALAGDYDNQKSDINFTAVKRELLLQKGEIYTVKFVKDNDNPISNDNDNESDLVINGKTINAEGNSFFIVLPLKNETYFNVTTDIAYFKKNFKPKKIGALAVDTMPVYKVKHVAAPEGFPILVNTEDAKKISRKISATQLSIIPGSMYILTFGTADDIAKDQGVVIPLTKGVKYNLGTVTESKSDYNKTLKQMVGTHSRNDNSNGELIDISVLSKELDILSQRDIVFSLAPVKQLGPKTSTARNVLTTLAVDGRKYFITTVQQFQINLKLPQDQKVNIQTDLSYVKNNFDPSTVAMNIDTTSVKTDLDNMKPSVITDPVYDVIVVNFNLNDYSILTKAKNILEEKVIQIMHSDSRLYVTIKGYTDPLGDAAYNQKLSKNRALAVRDFLIDNGIGGNRIRTFSYGETQALQAGENWKDMTQAELQKYRKVEITMYLPKKK